MGLWLGCWFTNIFFGIAFQLHALVFTKYFFHQLIHNTSNTYPLPLLHYSSFNLFPICHWLYSHSIHVVPLQITTYYAEGRTKKEKRKVAEIKRGVIQPGENDIWSGVEMTIPPLPPSNLEYCRIIDIDYEFQVGGDACFCVLFIVTLYVWLNLCWMRVFLPF